MAYLEPRTFPVSHTQAAPGTCQNLLEPSLYTSFSISPGGRFCLLVLGWRTVLDGSAEHQPAKQPALRRLWPPCTGFTLLTPSMPALSPLQSFFRQPGCVVKAQKPALPPQRVNKGSGQDFHAGSESTRRCCCLIHRHPVKDRLQIYVREEPKQYS